MAAARRNPLIVFAFEQAQNFLRSSNRNTDEGERELDDLFFLIHAKLLDAVNRTTYSNNKLLWRNMQTLQP